MIILKYSLLQSGICCFGNCIYKYVLKNPVGSLTLTQISSPPLSCFSDISHFQEQNDLKGLLENLHQNIQAKERKNVEIMWLAATVGTLLSSIIPCHHDDQSASILGICSVGSNFCTLGYQMSLSIIQEIRHLAYQQTRTQDRRCIQQEKILFISFSCKFRMCLLL